MKIWECDYSANKNRKFTGKKAEWNFKKHLGSRGVGEEGNYKILRRVRKMEVAVMVVTSSY